MSGADLDVDVAVVGGGAVGMLLTAELARLGVRTAVLEREPHTVDLPKAGTLHGRTVQSLVRRGYLARRPAGPPGRTVDIPFHFAGLTALRIAAPAVEGPPIAGVPQAELERFFEKVAREHGAAVLRGRTVTGLEQAPDGVEVAARSGGRAVRVTARYAVGADGARGPVLRLAGITAAEEPPSTASLLGLVRLLDPGSAPAGWNPTPRGWTMINVSATGHSRVVTIDHSGPPRDHRAPLEPAELQETVSHIAGYDVPMADPRHLGRFSDYARLADRYRQGRVFLAGDAAHLHAPLGGQGLNLGLQDAIGLGWRLALAVRGRAGKGLLDGYHDERHPAARRVLGNVRAQTALMRPGPDGDALRALFTELLGLEEVNDLLGGMVSAQETAYPAVLGGSPWEGRFLPDLPLSAPGGRAASVSGLLAEGRPALLLTGADDGGCAEAAASWDAVRTVRAAVPSGPPAPALLLRPDGYIAWAGPADPEELRSALRHWFGDPAQPRAAGPGPAGARRPSGASSTGALSTSRGSDPR